jgi:hypothetical protein
MEILIISCTFFRCMWKVFGITTNLVAAGDVWQNMLVKLSERKKDKGKFLELNQKAEVSCVFDTVREIHIFYVRFPDSTEMEDLKFFEHFVVKLTKSTKAPTLEYQGVAQKFMVVITAEADMNEYSERQKTRDERAQALNDMLEKEEKAFR